MLRLNETLFERCYVPLGRTGRSHLFATQLEQEAGGSLVTSQSTKISYQKVKSTLSLNVKRWNEEEERLNFMIEHDKQKEDQEKKQANENESQDLAKQDRRVRSKQRHAGM